MVDRLSSYGESSMSNTYDAIVIGAGHMLYKKEPLCLQGLMLVDL